MQETTFPVEIFIHDDASKDKTARIISEYQKLYPNILRTKIQEHNQWSLHGNRIFFKYLSKMTGKYIAICEGDDYWISRDKLEKQVATLNKNPQASGCYHQVYVEENGKRHKIYPDSVDLKEADLVKVLRKHFIPTCSFLIRKQKDFDKMNWAEGLYMGDWPLITKCAEKGTILPIKGIHAVYRNHCDGIWNRQSSLKRGKELKKFYDKAFRKYKKHITHELKKYRKDNLAFISASAFEEDKYFDALKAYLNYLFSLPKPFSLPLKQKRVLLYLLSLGLINKKSYTRAC